MGRFARNQDAVTSTGQTRRSDVIAVPGFSRKPEIKSNKAKPRAHKFRASKFIENRAKGMKVFWIALISIIGLSAGWMLGQAWINPEQIPTQVASVVPSAYAETSAPATPSDQTALSEEDGNFIEPGSQPDQDSDYNDRRPNKAHRTVARAPRARAQEGPVTMMLKPFKAINPLKLRKLRPW